MPPVVASPETAIAVVLIALIGVAMGLLGGGGSLLTVPLFVYLLGYPAKPAIVMGLPVVGLTCLVSAIQHYRAGNTDLRLALVFAPVTMLGAFAGARAASLVSGEAQLAMLGCVILVAAAAMFRSSRALGAIPIDGVTTPEPAGHHPALVAVTGGAVGLLTGLVGVGGGFLFVPALVVLGRVQMKRAIGTSLLVTAFTTAAAFVGYAGRVPVAWDVVGVMTAVAVVGALAGTALCGVVSQTALKRGFALFLVAIGTFVLYRNR